MELTLLRDTLRDGCTLGTLAGPGLLFQTLEDADRGLLAANPLTWARKIKTRTAIPTGRYEVALSHSARFGRLLPLLLGVPAFAGIRLHSGNTAADTEGCVLVGLTRAINAVRESRTAEQRLVAALVHASRREKIFLTVGYAEAVTDTRSGTPP